VFVGNAVRWVIRDRLTLGARTGPAIGLFSQPGRFPVGFRQRSWDLITLFAVLLPPAGGGVFRRLGPTCRYAICPPRVSSSRGLSTTRASCIGFWGLAPQTSRAVRSIGPARAFVHRAESDSPAMTALSFGPFSGFILRPPASTSGAYPPMGFSRLATANLQCFATTSRVPFGVLRGRRRADPAVFPPDQHSRPRFFRRP